MGRLISSSAGPISAGGIKSIQSGIMIGSFGSDVVVPINKVDPVKSRLRFYWRSNDAGAEENSILIDHVLNEESFSLNLSPGAQNFSVRFSWSQVAVNNLVWELIEYV